MRRSTRCSCDAPPATLGWLRSRRATAAPTCQSRTSQPSSRLARTRCRAVRWSARAAHAPPRRAARPKGGLTGQRSTWPACARPARRPRDAPRRSDRPTGS
eukprot:106081-Chlamydomonas_euryale.AAC.1